MVEDRETVGEDSWQAPAVLVFRSCTFSAPISVLGDCISMRHGINHQRAIAKMFSRSEVKDQGQSEVEKFFCVTQYFCTYWGNFNKKLIRR